MEKCINNNVPNYKGVEKWAKYTLGVLQFNENNGASFCRSWALECFYLG
jgi:hypothetical protein